MKTKQIVRSLTITVLAASITAQADVITDWNNAALNAIRGNRTSPPHASRALAILHASMYDAVNGISRTHEHYLVPSTVPASANKVAAASAAAHTVLSALFPTNTPAFDALHESTLDGVRDGQREKKGVNWGREVAQQILAARATDGATTPLAIPTATGPGYWVPTPPANAAYLLPQWAALVPFTMTTPAQFRPPGPPALDSERYTTDFNEVKALGRNTNSTRTPDQSQIAVFWADGAGTETPPGHWNSIAQDVGSAAGNTMEENARLFALLNLAMADAGIAAWDAKYFYFNWRPVTAIRQADSDGNPNTEPDTTWASFVGTPPFPDYISGHSTFSAAAAVVLADFYGTDSVPFTTGSDALPGITRSFTSFSSAAAEAARSRVYGGIHFQFASDDGYACGAQIGNWAIAHYLHAKGNRSRK